jgi:site-specific DNA-methyltransferase (adenine-specific)
MLYFEVTNCKLYCADMLHLAIAPESVDLIVTSPPYGLGKSYGVCTDDWSFDAYVSLFRDWMVRCYEWLKSDGRACVNIPLDVMVGGRRGMGAVLTNVLMDVGFQYHATIVWDKGYINARTAWGSWRSARAPNVITPVELIVVVYKHEWRKRVSGVSDLTRNEFMDWVRGVWSIKPESAKRLKHPAPFPLELPKRCIKLFSYVGDTVLDPFAGSGTTLLAAMMHNRQAIGIEIEPAYCELAKQRIIHYLNTRQPALAIADEIP